MRETIAFDIDDVLVDTAPAILRHYESNYGIVVPVHSFYDRDLTIWGVDDYSIATERVGGYLTSPEFDAQPPIPEAVLAVQAISRVHKVVAVTGRPSVLQEQTETWLDKHFGGAFETIRLTNHFNERHVPKGEVCDELGADWLIDDHIAHLLTLGHYGIRGMLFGGRPWGLGHELPHGVYEAKTWQDVKERLGV